MTDIDKFNSLLNKAQQLLKSESLKKHATGYDREPLINKANSLGGPKMKLIHWKRLRELARIPHSDESETIDAIDGINLYGAPKVEIFMISHRWLRPSQDPQKAHPDYTDNRKAMAINEFSKWRIEWVQNKQGFIPEIYYWIDYCCIDQSDSLAAIPLLPLWVACCERLLRIETVDYNERAWCRLEPLLSHVYSFTDHQTCIDIDFRSNWPDTGTETLIPLHDPSEGIATNPLDMEYISIVSELTKKTKPVSSYRSEAFIENKMVKCYKL